MRGLITWTFASAALVPAIQNLANLAECGTSGNYTAECGQCGVGLQGVCLCQGAGDCSSTSTKKVCVPPSTYIMMPATSLAALATTCPAFPVQDAIDVCKTKSVCEMITVTNADGNVPATVAGVGSGTDVPCWRFHSSGPLMAHGVAEYNKTDNTASEKGTNNAQTCMRLSPPVFTPTAPASECIALCTGGASGDCYKADCSSCGSGGICVCKNGECTSQSDERVCLEPGQQLYMATAQLDLVDAQCPLNKIKPARTICDGSDWCTLVTPTSGVIADIINQKVYCRKYVSDGDMMASQSLAYSREDCLGDAPVSYVQSSVTNTMCQALTCASVDSGDGPCYLDDCSPCDSGLGVCVCKEGSCTKETDQRVCLEHTTHQLLGTDDLDAVDRQCPQNKIKFARTACTGQSACDAVLVDQAANVITALQGKSVLCRVYPGGTFLSQNAAYTVTACNSNSPIPYIVAKEASGDITTSGCTSSTPGEFNADCSSCGSYGICVCLGGICTQATDTRVCLTSAHHFLMDEDSKDMIDQQCDSNVHRAHFDLCQDAQLCEKVEDPSGNVMAEILNAPTYCGYENAIVGTPAPTPGTATFTEVLHLFSQAATVVDYASCVASAGYTAVPSGDYTSSDTSCKKSRCKDRSLGDDVTCYTDNCDSCTDGGVCTCKLGLCKSEIDERVCTKKSKYKTRAVCPDKWAIIGTTAQSSAFTTIANDDCVGLQTCDACSSVVLGVTYGGRCVYNTATKGNVCFESNTMGLKLGSQWSTFTAQCPNLAGMPNYCGASQNCKASTYMQQECFCTKYDGKSMCSFEISDSEQTLQCTAATRSAWWSSAPQFALLFFALSQ